MLHWQVRKDDAIPYFRILICLSALLPIGGLYYAIFRYCIDIPFSDDFDLILGTLMSFLDAETLKEKMSILFSQHTQHRPVFARAVMLFFYHLRGSVDFRMLIYIGNLCGLALMTFLYLSTERRENRFLHFVPSVYFFFQPQYWESIVQASGALSNIPGVFFSIVSVSLAATPGKKRLILSLFFGTVAAFTYGAGLFVMPIVAALLTFRKRYRELLVLIAAAAVVFSVYFIGYYHPGGHPDIGMAFKNPAAAIKYFFMLLGAPLAITKKSGCIYMLGAVSALLFALLTAKRYYVKNTVIYASLAFLFVVVLAISLSRSGFGLWQAMESRYRFIPALILSLECIGLLELAGREKAKKVFPLLLAASMLFNVYSFSEEYRRIKEHRVLLARGVLQYRILGIGLAYPPDPIRADSVIKESAKRKIYFLPDIKTLYGWSEFAQKADKRIRNEGA